MGLAQTVRLKPRISNIHSCIGLLAPGRRISVFAPGVQPGDLVATTPSSTSTAAAHSTGGEGGILSVTVYSGSAILYRAQNIYHLS